MAKVGGSYESVVRGVSEQAPQDRRSGQMWEQVNMISDPVRGLTRRQGSEYLNSQLLGIRVDDVVLEDVATQYTNMDYFCEGKEYELIYSKSPVRRQIGHVEPLYCYNKSDNKFMYVHGSGPIFDAMRANGIASMVNVGKFVFIAAKGWATQWKVDRTNAVNGGPQDGVVWVRNGDFARSYGVGFVHNGTYKWASYKTPSSSYPGALNTSDIHPPTINVDPSDNADVINRKLAEFNSQMATYNKQVADRTNAYNSAVTAYIGESTAQIQPEFIASKLRESMVAQGVDPNHVATAGSYLTFSLEANITTASVEDGGDGSYMRAVVNVVDDPTNLTPKHYNGKVVKVTAKKSNDKDAYYMKAFSKNGAWGFQEVTWKEAAGEITTPTLVFAFGVVTETGMYIASTATDLQGMSGVRVPGFQPSTVGDTISSPQPNFFGKEINYLGVFQDRLLVGQGATIFASRPGNYLSFFRSTILAVEDNDPVEMFALGSEDDTIYWDTSFDRNHVLFGQKFQYIIPGRALLTPKNPSIQIMSAHEDAVLAEPQNSGNFVFFAKDTARKGSLHQIQMGATSDSSEAYECSQQLDKYMKGRPCQIMCNTAPFVIMIRSRNYSNGLYLYTYLDSMQGNERLFDSWSRWEWDKKLGPSCGMAKWRGDIHVYTMRNTESGLWLVADRFNFDTDLAETPYLDSWRQMNVAEQYPLWHTPEFNAISSLAYQKHHEYFMLGSAYDKRNENMDGWQNHKDSLVVGINYQAYSEITSPYIRDRNDKAIIAGRLTLSTVTVAVSDTSSLDGYVITGDRTTQTARFDGRILTRPQNRVGRTPVATTTVSVPVFKEIREHRLRLSASKWLPLTITGLEWVGQWFSNVRRV